LWNEALRRNRLRALASTPGRAGVISAERVAVFGAVTVCAFAELLKSAVDDETMDWVHALVCSALGAPAPAGDRAAPRTFPLLPPSPASRAATLAAAGAGTDAGAGAFTSSAVRALPRATQIVATYVRAPARGGARAFLRPVRSPRSLSIAAPSSIARARSSLRARRSYRKVFGAVESVDVRKVAKIRARAQQTGTLAPALGRALPVGSRRTQRKLAKKHAKPAVPEPVAAKMRASRTWAEGRLGRETKTW
jgi:hypothetical protein